MSNNLGFPEGTTPRNSDAAERSLQKINAILDQGGPLASFTPAPGSYDAIVLDPPAKPTTVTYKVGGTSGTTVATLTLTYSGDDVATVTRS
jgi:hypothetical protein